MKKVIIKISAFAGKCWRKFKEFCKYLSKKVEEAVTFITNEENSEAIMTILTVVSLGSTVIKHISRKAPAYQNEREYQRLHIYDNSLGHHWALRKELTPNQMMELDRRKRAGESYGQILESMRVLL